MKRLVLSLLIGLSILFIWPATTASTSVDQTPVSVEKLCYGGNFLDRDMIGCQDTTKTKTDLELFGLPILIIHYINAEKSILVDGHLGFAQANSHDSYLVQGDTTINLWAAVLTSLYISTLFYFLWPKIRSIRTASR